MFPGEAVRNGSGGVLSSHEINNSFKDWMKLMAKVSPVLFFRQVKQEVKKVTWPTRKEVVQTSIMVLILVAIAAAFFFCVDQVFGFIVKLIFG